MKRCILSLALTFALATPVYAQTAEICGDLRARLADLPQVIGTTPEVRKYASAIAEQNIELRKVRSDLKRNGCTAGSMVVIGGENAAYCQELDQAQTQMIDNIRNLQDERDALREQSEGTRARNELMSALDTNGCNDQQWGGTDAPEYEPAPSIADQAMRNDTFISPGGDENRRQLGYPGAYGAHLNTVCVRTCDGGFFPIRSNASSMDFARDANTCAQMCPGIDTELFYHDVSSTETSNMTSVTTGAPYSAMPNAFAYKNRKPGEKAACGCDLAGYYERMRKGQNISEPPHQGSITTIETKKPETKAVEAAAPQSQVPDRPYDPAASTVRQIGPQFLAGEQGAIDLKHPASPGPQPLQNQP